MNNIIEKPTNKLLKLDSYKFYLGLAIALGLHLLLVGLPIAFWVDMNLYKSWAIDVVNQGIGNFYGYATNCDYPPAYLYVLWLIGKIYQLADPTFSQAFSHTDGLLLMVMIKIPPVLANIASAFLIVQILKPHTTINNAYKLGLLYAFNPLLLFVSAHWGQIDGLIACLMLLVFYLIQHEYLISSGILIAAMTVIKPQGLFIAPFLLLSQWFRQAWWKWGAIAIGGVGIVGLLIMPFYPIKSLSLIGIVQPFVSLYKLVKGTADYYSFASVNAFNFWGWANWVRDYETFVGISYKVIGLSLLGILVLCLGGYLYYQRHFAAHCLAVATLLFGAFMLPTRMHERYMIYALAFLAIAIALVPAIKWIYWGLTFTGSVNVGYAYLRYNHENLFESIPETWLQSVVYAMSAINVILFLVMLFQTFRLQAPVLPTPVNQSSNVQASFD